jgi:DNA polymerase V
MMKAQVLGVYKKNANVNLPLFASRPAAGFPAPGDDQVERPLDLNDLLIDHPEATFFVRVEGDSMEGAGIFSGDILVVDRALTVRSGDIVVAAVYGEMVVKEVEIKGDALRLMSRNESYEPIVVSGAEDCHVWGVVVGSVRMLR